MPKLSFIIRELKITPALQRIFESEIIQDNKPIAPGQVLQKGDWYYLIYLRSTKVKNFDTISWDLVEQDYDSIRAAVFKISENKLIVKGSKTDINEIEGYFQALTLKLATDNQIVISEHFTLTPPTIDLFSIIKKFEEKELIENVVKTKMKNMEINMGKINSCTVNTKDYYDKVRNSVETEPDNVSGIEIFVKNLKKTSIYYGTDGTVRISSKSDDIDLESQLMEYISEI